MPDQASTRAGAGAGPRTQPESSTRDPPMCSTWDLTSGLDSGLNQGFDNGPTQGDLLCGHLAKGFQPTRSRSPTWSGPPGWSQPPNWWP